MKFKRNYLQTCNWRKGKKINKPISIRFLLVLLCLVGMVGSVMFAVQIAFASSKVISLENEERKIVNENKELEEKLIKGDSLTDLTSKANDLGFSQLGEIVYLNQGKSMAKLP
jgi:cell division protein FtsB